MSLLPHFFMVLLFGQTPSPPAPPVAVIKLRGSDTMGAKMVPMLAEAFKASGQKVKFDMAAEGSTTAFPPLLLGTAGIGMASREIKPAEKKLFQEKGIEITRWDVCRDMIAVVVHASNPVDQLTSKQVEAIFTGDVTNWNQVGGADALISVYTRNTSSGTYRDWQKLAMNGRDYAGSANKSRGDDPLHESVVKDTHGIGYVGLAYIKAKGIKVVKIDGQEPSLANIHVYPYARKLLYYTRADLSAPARAFVDFTLFNKGADVIRKTGFIPEMDAAAVPKQ